MYKFRNYFGINWEIMKIFDEYTDVIWYGKVNKNSLAEVQEYRVTNHIEEQLLSERLKLWRDDSQKMIF